MICVWCQLQSDGETIPRHRLAWLSSCHSPGPAFTVAELGDMNNGPAPASICWWCHHPGQEEQGHETQTHALASSDALRPGAALLPDQWPVLFASWLCCGHRAHHKGQEKLPERHRINQVNQTTSLTSRERTSVTWVLERVVCGNP